MRAWWCGVLLLWAGAAAAEDVVDVIDGNHVVVQAPGGPRQTVRLAGIDAPALCQPFGPEARDALRDWARGQPVTVKLQGGKSAPGHPLAVVLLDGQDLGRRMVEEGYAWSTRGRNDRGPFIKQERMAKALARGLHSQGGAVMPKEWRRTHAPC